MFVIYNRRFNAIHNGVWMTFLFADTTYTYMDLELAHLGYSNDPEFRFDAKLIIDWMKNKHLRLSRFPWKYGIKPTNSGSKLLIGKQLINSKENYYVPMKFQYLLTIGMKKTLPYEVL